MPDRLRTTVARLAREKGLVLVGLVSTVGLFYFFGSLIADILSAPEPSSTALGYLLVGVVLALFYGAVVVAPLIGLLSFRATWIAQKTVRETVRKELRVRKLKADPQSTYGLPGFPDTRAGSGELATVEGGGLTDAGPDSSKNTNESPPEGDRGPAIHGT